MDIVKAINLGDYQMLVQLEVSGPEFGFQSVIKAAVGKAQELNHDQEIYAAIDVEAHKKLIEERLS